MFIALAAPPEQEDYFIGLSHTEKTWEYDIAKSTKIDCEQNEGASL